MKKILMTALIIMLTGAVISDCFAQTKKKETRKEKQARIEKMVADGAAQKDFFIEIGRIFPKNGVAQNIVYDTKMYYIDCRKDRLFCNLPYIGQAEISSRTAYGSEVNSSMGLSAHNQVVTIIGGWQEKVKSYLFQVVFWNGDIDYDKDAKQVTLTIQMYKSGKVYAMAAIRGYENVSYEGEIAERPEEEKPNPLTAE